MDENESLETMNGTIIFQDVNIGSKSECRKPFLYVSQDDVVPLFMKNSNPFENNELKEFDGKQVSVTGYRSDKKFIVTEIKL